MKIIIFSLSFLLVTFACHSQLLKKIVNDVKDEAEWKMRVKARQKTNEAIDSLLNVPKKGEKKSKPKKSETKQSSSVSNSADEEMMGEGFIQLSVSATEVFKGGTVAITGSSVKYEGLTEVKMTISSEGTNESKSLKLYENGSFASSWQTEKAGDFTITIASSDGKDHRSAKVKVYDIELMDDWTNENKEETEKANELLKKNINKVQAMIGDKDKEELNKKMKEVEEDVDLANKFFDELNAAGKELGKVKSPLRPNLAKNLSKLNDVLFEHRTEMRKLRELADHEPYDNTICEYLVMLNEACAAFTTFTNILAKLSIEVLKELAKDYTPIGDYMKGKSNSNGYSEVVKTPAILFAKSKLSAESITAANFTGDLAVFATSYLLKKYCGIISGTVNHDYQIIYRNKLGTVWWKYDYKTAAAITLRYPKNNSGGKIIKMKGNIEGNATQFNFFQDVEQMDEFKEQMKGRAKLTAIFLHKPTAVPFSTTKFDGLGAVARGMGTPSYFYIPVDAEYDTDADRITIFLKEPMIDFSALVNYTYAYVGIAAGIPLVTRVTFPINKVKLTLNAVVSKNNELEVSKDAKKNLNIKGKGERHIGSETDPIEHNINFTLTAKNEN